MNGDRESGPTAHANGSGAIQTPISDESRVLRDPDAPLYELQDRRYSGEWRTVETFTDPIAANEAKALLLSVGATAVRVVTVPSPIIP